MNINYSNLINHIDSLPWCALVTTGRVGSDFFQSLLDSHPEVFVFNGSLFFHDFWKQSHSARNSINLKAEDIIDEFIGHFIYKFKSKYDYIEGKDKLGESCKECIDIDTKEFRQYLLNLISPRPICSKFFLQSVYVAYAMCLKQEIIKKKLFLHHIHHIWKLDDYLKDFPESKIISMTRDPRAAFVSGVEHWFRFKPETDYNLWRVFITIDRIIKDASELKKYNNKFAILRLEDLGNEKILRKVCDWLGVLYDSCLQKSTWAGLKWRGDKLSVNEPDYNEKGFSKKIIQNDWERKLKITDKYLFNFLFSERLKYYGYPLKHYRWLHHYIIVFFVILFPSTYEWKFLSSSYFLKQLKEKQYKNILKIYYYYIKRIILYYKLFYKKIIGEKLDFYIFKNGDFN